MTRTAILDALTELFLPTGPVSLIARLIVWCGMSVLIFILLDRALGHDDTLHRHMILIALTSTPLAVLTMAIASHWRHLQTDLIEISSTDAMTGLMNRRAFFEAMETAPCGALLVVDIDHFKSVNDRYGHTVGDSVLISVADHLQKNIREEDLLGRIGGEEFGIFLGGADSQHVDVVGERICRGLIVYNEAMSSPVKVTMSIGTAYAAMAPDLLELYRRADEALFQAKRSGRARLNFWQPTFHVSR